MLDGGRRGAVLATRAPAKINLTLHICGRRPDGYHELDSLVAFARVGDELELAPDDATSLIVAGPERGAIGPSSDNLVLRAAAKLSAEVPGLRSGQFRLVKRLPVAAGLGGGSSDAAAALRLLAELNGLTLDDPRILDAARETGADVPVCLDRSARRMSGIGEVLSPPSILPRLPALLVNPRVALPTAEVFRKLGLAVGTEPPGMPHPSMAGARTKAMFVHALATARNDLEPPAIALAPVVAEALGLVAALPGCRLARMSGSGATVFGLFDTCRASATAAKAVRAAQPGWWISATMLG